MASVVRHDQIHDTELAPISPLQRVRAWCMLEMVGCSCSGRLMSDFCVGLAGAAGRGEGVGVLTHVQETAMGFLEWRAHDNGDN